MEIDIETEEGIIPVEFNGNGRYRIRAGKETFEGNRYRAGVGHPLVLLNSEEQVLFKSPSPITKIGCCRT